MSTELQSDRPIEFVSASGARVEEAMHPGVLTCTPETPLRSVARMMARYRVHAIVVYSEEERPGDQGVWGVVSDADLVAATAVGDLDGRTAGSAARTALVTTLGTASIRDAAELMTRHRVTHLVVVSSSARRPVGVLSSMDVARAVALEPGHDR